jgi:heat shock protein HslJ
MMQRPTVMLAVLISLSLMVAACGGSSPSTSASHDASVPATLAGTHWSVLSVGGRTSVAGHAPTMAFDGTRVQGSGGCNTYGGSYAYVAETGTLTFGELQSTLMGCLGPQGDFEGVFLSGLGGPMRVTAAGDQLTLTGAKGAIVLIASS